MLKIRVIAVAAVFALASLVGVFVTPGVASASPIDCKGLTGASWGDAEICSDSAGTTYDYIRYWTKKSGDCVRPKRYSTTSGWTYYMPESTEWCSVGSIVTVKFVAAGNDVRLYVSNGPDFGKYFTVCDGNAPSGFQSSPAYFCNP